MAKNNSAPKALEDMSDAELRSAYHKEGLGPKPLEEMTDEELASLYKTATEKPGMLDKAETFFRGAFSGATAGISEPVISGANAALETVLSKAMGLEDAGMAENFADNRAHRKELKEELPGYDMAGELVGAVAPTPINLGGTIFKGASKIAKALPGLREGVALTKELRPLVGPAAPASLLEKAAMAATKVGTGAVEGAVGGAGYEAVRQAAEGSTGFIDPNHAPGDVARAALMGGALGGAVPAVIEGVKSIPWIGKKMLSSLGGVKTSDIDSYLADPEALKAAKSPDEIYTMLEEKTGQIRKAVDEATLTREQAEKAFDRLEGQVKLDARQKKYDLGNSVTEARNSLNSALTSKLEEIKAVKPPGALVDDVLDATDALKRRLVEESRTATEILSKPENAGKAIPRNAILGQIDSAIDKLKVAGEDGERVAVTETSELAISRLEKMKERFGKLSEEIPLPQAKEITKQLDKDIDFLENAGAFHDDPSNAALSEIRRFLRKEVGRQVPEYDAYMEAVVAPLGELRAEASKRFGKREAVQSKLTRIDSPLLEEDRRVLKGIADVTERDFETPLQAYRDAQSQLTGTGRAAVKAGLPEAQALAEAEAAHAATMVPGAQDAEIAATLAASPEGAAMKAAMEQETAQKAIFEQIESLTRGSIEKRVATLMKGNDRNTRRAFEALSKLSDTDFVQMIERARLDKAFSGEFRIGSRNVNLWTVLSIAASLPGIAGGVLTGGMGIVAGLGAAAAATSGGALFGGLIDRFGPGMTKQILSTVSQIQGTPTLQKIMRTAGSPEVRDEMIRDLVEFAIIGNRDRASAVLVPADARRQVRYDIRNAPNMGSVQKAKMLDHLNRSGELIQSDELILGGVPTPPKRPETARPRPQAGERLRSTADFVRRKKPEAY